MAGPSDSAVSFSPARPLRGTTAVPADKSISHRAAMVASLCGGKVVVRNFLEADDTRATLQAMASCGVTVERHGGGMLTIHGVGLRGLKPPGEVIDIGNSGTSIRLLPGIFAGQQGEFILDGDESIRRRPMDRVVAPLSRMGIAIEARDGSYAPLKVTGGEVQAIDFELPVASAQVKSAVLLAGMYAAGPTSVTEPAVCRDHTERLLAGAGADVTRSGLKVTISPVAALELESITVPGDFSSAAFILAACAVIEGSAVRIENVGVNPTRTGLLDIMAAMGAAVRIENQREEGGEPVGDLLVESSSLRGASVGGEISGRAIDELPLVALLAAFAEGETVVAGASELKVKESDRIAGLVANMAAVGVEIEARDDGFAVSGGGGVRGGNFESGGDHRMAMLGAIAGLASREGVVVNGFDCVSVSFPDFANRISRLVGGGDVCWYWL
ncbi:MAG: 3-phosphoshikimate 1-carboxyvinyltransferase [Thermoleophilia bacterium]